MDLNKVFFFTRKIESLLENRYGGSGRGLHSKLDNIKGKIPLDITKKIRFIATIRNKLAHEDGYDLTNPDRFFSTCEQVIDWLEKSSPDLTIDEPKLADIQSGGAIGSSFQAEASPIKKATNSLKEDHIKTANLTDYPGIPRIILREKDGKVSFISAYFSVPFIYTRWHDKHIYLSIFTLMSIGITTGYISGLEPILLIPIALISPVISILSPILIFLSVFIFIPMAILLSLLLFLATLFI